MGHRFKSKAALKRLQREGERRLAEELDKKQKAWQRVSATTKGDT